MKTSLFKILTVTAGAALLFAGPVAHAESTYGYNATTPASPVSATARVDIEVNIPKLILLRVGSSGATIDTVTFEAAPTVGSVNPTWTDGDSQPVDWDGNAPTFAATVAAGSNATVNAYLWHNNTTTATLSCANSNIVGTLDPTQITVTHTGALAHPGANTGCTTPTTGLARNTALTGQWTYAVTPAAIADMAAGTNSERVTYTAVTL